MNATWTLLDLAGAVALLLWGVHMVQTGIQRAFGPDLRRLLSTALHNRIAAFGAGLGVTAVLQSSTATGLMVSGFAASGFVELVPALAVMLGANVGTTLIVQVLSFDVASISPALVLVGVIVFRRAHVARTRDLGRVAIGLGLMLLALRELLMLVTPYEDAPSLRLILGSIATEPVVDVLIAAALTWAAHSSVAVVLLVMSLAAKGAVPPHAAYALVLGANLGSAINPVLEGVSGDDPVARRLPIGNLLNRLIGCVLALALLDWLGPIMARWEPGPARAVADFHTGFNLVLALVFMPVLAPFAALLRRMLPARDNVDDPSRPRHLDEGGLEMPAVALASASREALRMADVLETMLTGASEALAGADRQRISGTRRLDDVIDALNTAIRHYLARLDVEALTEADHRRLTEILVFSTNLEAAADVVDRNIMGHVARRQKRGLPPPGDEREQARQLLERLSRNLRAASAVFMTQDTRAARQLVAEKDLFRDMEAAATTAHFARVRSGEETSEASSLSLDLLRDLGRVNAHFVAAGAYPVLESQGELLPSRLRLDP